ncbi:hypothetical protein ALC62_03437 [Cyphomyrmex costatus]|uniref:Uncharacterized protein n=1 Tax=Cyphomyrmex costatus TaxID=456900 RepID=A0A195CZT3_9HYME|nr:hypothetical protein ALC62_03437 [Cyphomyrmex costatus]
MRRDTGNQITERYVRRRIKRARALRYNQPHQNYRRSTADPDKSVASSASSSFTISQCASFASLHLHRAEVDEERQANDKVAKVSRRERVHTSSKEGSQISLERRGLMPRKILSTFSLEIDDSRDTTCKDKRKNKRNRKEKDEKEGLTG